ncbi:hypothetical protein B0T25DRAFT_533387 [Lasiosphaeria hispida]|uniref:C2H2-type domain-containing protein n=1 Tax=Lasiosphaeria hispida TaxID=260671 RepID=A0AAJ0HQH6_9PEZI|nr:hypothetical protein B0T25DRAFT_533387 [Lasiosphaeria hispida]
MASSHNSVRNQMLEHGPIGGDAGYDDSGDHEICGVQGGLADLSLNSNNSKLYEVDVPCLASQNASGGSQGTASERSKELTADEMNTSPERSSDDPQENNGDGSGPGDGRNRQEALGCGLACPFQVRNRPKFNPHNYPRCNQAYTTFSYLKIHIRQHHRLLPNPQGERGPENPEDGIDPSVEGQLTSRKGVGKVDSWKQLWMALFPDDDRDQIPRQTYEPSVFAEYGELENVYDQISTETNALFKLEMADINWGTPPQQLQSTLVQLLEKVQSASKDIHLSAFKKRLLSELPKPIGDACMPANPGESKVKPTSNGANKPRTITTTTHKKRPPQNLAQARPRKVLRLAPKVAPSGHVQSNPPPYPMPQQVQTQPGGQAATFSPQHHDTFHPPQPHIPSIAYVTTPQPNWQATPELYQGDTGVFFAANGLGL